MNTIIAIFVKQLNDFPRNLTVSLMYILFPGMAFVMGSLNGNMEASAGIFAAMFIGTTPMIAICMTVAEDREYKSLRFLVMAGVKPSQYLFGLTGFVLLMSILPLAFLIYIGGFYESNLFHFVFISILGLVASALLGAAIGIFSKNVQQATAIYTPLMMIMVMGPMFASANETLERIIEYLFSFQVFLIALHPEPDILQAYIIITANIIALLAFFIFAYKKKGMRG